MTRDDITTLASQVGAFFDVYGFGRTDGVLFTPNELERFAALVAAAEREACAEHYLAVMRKAIEEEREQCAKLCEKQKSNWNYCAAAIRARSQA